MKKLLAATAIGLIAIGAAADPLQIAGIGWGTPTLWEDLERTGYVCEPSQYDEFITECFNGNGYLTIHNEARILDWECGTFGCGAGPRELARMLLDTMGKYYGITQFDYEPEVITANGDAWEGYCADGPDGDKICVYERFVSTAYEPEGRTGITIYENFLQPQYD